jgi:hypothetical protein
MRPVRWLTCAQVSDGRASKNSTGCSTRAYASKPPGTTERTVPSSPGSAAAIQSPADTSATGSRPSMPTPPFCSAVHPAHTL